MTLFLRAALPLVLALAPAFPVLAADYDPPIYVETADDYVPVEVGSGWYLRGDVGYALNKPFRHTSTLPGFTEDTVLASGSVGMGYQFNSFIRGEINAGILPTDRFGQDFITTCSGTETTTVRDNLSGIILSQLDSASSRSCEGSDEARNKAYNLSANVYADLGTFVGFTPYVGAGAGITYNKYALVLGDLNCQPDSVTTVGGGTTTTTSFACTDTASYDGAVASEGRYDFSYSLAAGVSYQATKNVSLDLGYEYFSIPTARYLTYNAGVYSVNEGLDYHQVKLGVRYALW